MNPIVTVLSGEQLRSAHKKAELHLEAMSKAKNTRTYGHSHGEVILRGAMGEAAVCRLCQESLKMDPKDGGWDLAIVDDENKAWLVDVKQSSYVPPYLRVNEHQIRSAKCHVYALTRVDHLEHGVVEFWGVMLRTNFLKKAEPHDFGHDDKHGRTMVAKTETLSDPRAFLEWVQRVKEARGIWIA